MRLQQDDADDLQNVEQELEISEERGKTPCGQCGPESALAFTALS